MDKWLTTEDTGFPAPHWHQRGDQKTYYTAAYMQKQAEVSNDDGERTAEIISEYIRQQKEASGPKEFMIKPKRTYKKKPRKIKQCLICGKDYPVRASSKFCGDECSKIATAARAKTYRDKRRSQRNQTA